MPPAPVVAAAAPVTQQMNSNNKNIVSGKVFLQYIDPIFIAITDTSLITFLC